MSKFEDFGKRIKDVRPPDYGEGAIVGYVKDGDEYWVIRWDDSGLDNEWLERREFEFIEPHIHTDACKDCVTCGHPECRHVNGKLCNYAHDCDCVEFKSVEPERECTCNDYPHHELCGAVQDYPDQEPKNG